MEGRREGGGRRREGRGVREGGRGGERGRGEERWSRDGADMKEKERGDTLSNLFYFQIDYFNNKIICDLMEASRTGIIALLDEACFLVGTVTDKVTINPFFTEPLTLYSLMILEQYYKNKEKFSMS